MPKVTMPQLGESVAEGTIGKWLKQVGEHVEKYEPIVEVITDKVNAEVPSPFAGTLTAILVQEGETVPNNAEIAEIDGEGAASSNGSAPSTAAAARREPKRTGLPVPMSGRHRWPRPPQPRAAARPEPTEYEGRLTPAVRRLAREHDIDLAHRERHGPRRPHHPRGHPGLRGGPADRPCACVGTGADYRALPPRPRPRDPRAAPVSLAADSLKPQTPMRKAIAAQMTRALSVPVAYTLVEVDMSAVIARREAAKAEYQAREGMNLSFVAFVTKAAVEALRAHPDLNAHYTEEGHWRRKAINVGVAVAVDDGLVVPVIRDADSLSIHGLNRAINETGRAGSGEQAAPRRRRGRHVHRRQHGLDRLGHHPADHQRARGRPS